MLIKKYYVYIMTNKRNTVLYVGVTNSLSRRSMEHREKHSPRQCFTKRYNINKLVYFEPYDDIRIALARERQIKDGSRNDKLRLINENNPEWKDLIEAGLC